MTLGLSLAPRRVMVRAVALLPLSLLGASAISCSDPVPVAAQGNFSFQLGTNAAGAPSRCQLPNKVFGFGEPSTADPGKRTADGESGVSVSCKVRKQGDAYVVEGNVKKGADTFYVNSTDVDVTSGVGSALVVASSGASIGYETCTQLNCPGVTDPPFCTFEVISDQIRSGAVWAKVSCPMLVAPSEQSYCTASAVFVLENCEE
ncbi:MAG: hypothetical protein H6718_01120 [Polyangiaceae bacterium]|nr:hypothetical protein [Myxococcales bacterium]MCB9583962.1 hypothetical protein [Polyangiaceae bacterium]MCB9607782.1 hypothetical protein [Polyangiaceae bacterium]